VGTVEGDTAVVVEDGSVVDVGADVVMAVGTVVDENTDVLVDAETGNELVVDDVPMAVGAVTTARDRCAPQPTSAPMLIMPMIVGLARLMMAFLVNPALSIWPLRRIMLLERVCH
jgi:hypothetical protein